MRGKILEKIGRATMRHHLMVVALAIVAIGFVWWSEIYQPKANVEFEVPAETMEMTIDGPLMTEAEPVMLRIPKLELEVPFGEPLGLTSSSEVEVPDSYDEVGYYKFGPTPGELGPAVVLGHVDSKDGPSVFYYLGRLDEGDEVYIDRGDGTTAVFEVTKLERHEQSGFPTREVYQDIDHAGLRLITCSGTYDREIQRYSHNLIVFARLKTDNE